ncbi:MAG: DUF4105 domain-containing protein [Treponema sp.]|nr:DUF4105 domain-containing protein [Treponema sp.]
MIKKILLIILLLFFTGTSFVFSQDYQIKLAVMGAGSPVYFWWGHIGLIIENTSTGQSRFYDWGLFSFNSDNFIKNFIFGRLLYSCGVSSTEYNIEVYKYYNRSVKIYTLDFPQETIMKVLDFAENNVLPENRDYYYHIFDDNCSTRIRDIIDLATEGQFSARYKNEASVFTLRDHVRRRAWFSPVVEWFLNFLMGQNIDSPITVWDDMFAPAEVGKNIEDFYYYDINGIRRKLVTSSEVVFESAGRLAVLDAPRAQWRYQLAFGIFLALIFCLFFYLQSKNIKAGKVLAGVSVSICGIIFGVCGALLYFLAIFTNHDYTYNNANMIFATPLLLVTVPLGIGYFAAKDKFKYLKYNLLIRIIWLLCAIGIIISMLIKLLPFFYQDNLPDQLLLLPVALVFSLHPFGLKEVLDKFSPKRARNFQRKKGGARGKQ